jgi:beta-phosphoglucomutase-like phosphatase (HAD superfamily)
VAAISAEPPSHIREYYGLTAGWRAALDAARRALQAGDRALRPAELHALRSQLAGEVDPTERLLRALAKDWELHDGFVRLTVSPWSARRLLGLPAQVNACVFNLEGVLIGSAAVHAAAWAETFDELLSDRVERTGGRFAPFNPPIDYPAHLHARPRLEGVRAFLASRGIRLPEGTANDPPGAETVQGLARRKNEALLRRLDRHGIAAFVGARRYLELAHDAGLHCAVVSASANTATILELAGLADLVEERIDGNTIRAEHLRVEPEPDTLLAACRKLGVAPERTAAFETTPAGVNAARRAGFDLVIGVDDGEAITALRAEGADAVIGGVAELLEHRLAA